MLKFKITQLNFVENCHLSFKSLRLALTLNRLSVPVARNSKERQSCNKMFCGRLQLLRGIIIHYQTHKKGKYELSPGLN